MNHWVFSTGGDWDSTTFYNNGREYLAERLFVQIIAGRDGYGEPERGGVALGGEATAIVNPQDNPQMEVGIFPGRLEMNFPGHALVIENTHPMFAFEFTRAYYNGQDITNNLMDIYVEIDAVQNIVKAFVTLFKPHFFGSDEVATYNII